MNKIQFGFMMPADQLDKSRSDTYVHNLNQAFDLIRGHFDSAWIIDHLQFDLEGFTSLSYMAALHPEFNFGHAVICQSFRNPALLAKMGATFQFLSGGRFILGLGAGWNEEEFKAYGYPFPSAGERVEQLEETLQIVKALWTQEKVTFHGKHYQVTEAYCEPKPVPVPSILIGAFQPKMLNLTARYADEWNVSSTGVVKYRRLVAKFEKACRNVGRDPNSVRRSWCGGCACASTQEEAELLAGDRLNAKNQEEDFDFVGTPAQIVEQMRAFIHMGVTRFIVDCSGFPNLSTLRLLVHEVLPALET
jgi:alkanesulfonate monooxygenase SsuD/methylene tetrahydromethanopterin reductase-like flavin-dependent oxidoreductase (luciferase family)